jgi:4-amino-4-deoxy-L-arabinose transferase-like glycosyltransferase
MADTLPAITPEESHLKLEPPAQRRFPAWHHLALAGITLISIFMNFYRLGAGGYGSYYPPAVRSMMDNWHNFFFASYDPGGFVTVDKPPVGFWLDVLSARIFGFNPVSILIPQALCGVLAVLLLYYLVRRHFGVVAGLIAALALAVSPISIVTNRNITIDSILALVLLSGAWTILRAAETGKLRWLLLTAVIVGIGFNIKMMEAYLVLPAFGVLYLVAAPHSIRKRVGHLALAALLLLAVSFSWIATVDSIPASQRPYVDSTTDNSELTLALGYNGVQRLLGGVGGFFRGGGGRGAGRGRLGGGGGFPNGTPPRFTGSGSGTPPNGTIPGGTSPGGTTNSNASNVQKAIQQALAAGGPGGLFATGNAGPLRLFLEPLASQIAWILPLALLGLLALLWQRRWYLQEDRQQQSMVLWGMWVLTMGVFFSVAGFFHPYYMTEMAPGIAALVGIGLVMMWRDYRQNGWKGWLLPLALAITIVEQVYILLAYPTWGRWMIPLLVVLGVLGVGTLVIARLLPHLNLPHLNLGEFSKDRLLMTSVGIGMLALLIGPTVWGAIPVLAHTQGDVLSAGPQGGGDFGGFGGGNANSASTTKLINYLEANQGNARFLVAVPSSQGITDQLIIATNKPVMSLGGFSGSDPILTTSQLAALVKNGTVRFFLINGASNGQGQTSQNSRTSTKRTQQGNTGGAGGFSGFGRQSTLTTWVTQNCKVVPSNLWQSSSSSITGGFGFGGRGFGEAQQLYDCASAQ